MAVTSTWLWFGGLILGAAGLVAACGSSGGSGNTGGSCIPNASAACACAGGATGTQVCAADGKSFGMCQCSGTTGTTGTGGSTTTTSATDGGTGCQCLNPAGEDYCGPICVDAGTKTDGGGTCAGKVTYAGKAPMQFGSNWSYKAALGLAAGDLACTEMGADHVCDYDDLVFAASKNELSTMATTDTAWLQRTHSVTVTATGPKIVVLGQPAAAGMTYDVNLGSRCANWVYSTDHVNDGEFVEFKNGGNSPLFHLDDKTGDGAANANVQTSPKDIPCGHNALKRDVLCCYAKCM